MTKANEPAFPELKTTNSLTNQYRHETIGGLTKREYFAGLAMQGLLSAVYSSKEMINEFMKKKYAPGPFDNVGEYLTGCEAVSRNAVSYADALLAELGKGDE